MLIGLVLVQFSSPIDSSDPKSPIGMNDGQNNSQFKLCNRAQLITTVPPNPTPCLRFSSCTGYSFILAYSSELGFANSMDPHTRIDDVSPLIL